MVLLRVVNHQRFNCCPPYAVARTCLLSPRSTLVRPHTSEKSHASLLMGRAGVPGSLNDYRRAPWRQVLMSRFRARPEACRQGLSVAIGGQWASLAGCAFVRVIGKQRQNLRPRAACRASHSQRLPKGSSAVAHKMVGLWARLVGAEKARPAGVPLGQTVA